MLASISVSNFLGVRHHVDTFGRMNLISGGNAAGKTSLLDAIRFGLTGDMQRVTLKKDARAIVTEGTRSAQVELFFDDDTALRRALPSLDSNGEPSASYQSPTLPLVLNAERFAALSVTDRRSALFAATNTTLDRKWVGDRLAEERIPLHIIEATIPMLRQGFEAGCESASKKTTESRGVWKGITGEAYGSVKAESWRAPRPDAPGDVEAMRLELAEADRLLSKARERLGVAKSAAALGAIPDDDAIAGSRNKLKEADARLAELQKERADAAEAAAGAGGAEVPCPCCGEVLVVAGATLKKYVPPQTGRSRPQSHTVAAELSRKIAEAEKWVGDKRSALARMEAQREAAKALNGDDGAPGEPAPAVKEVEADIDQLSQTCHRLRMEFNATEEALRVRKEADDREKRATEAHEDVQSWDRTAKLLAPDGLPAELLLKAVGPFRDLLADRPDGWPAITLADDMEIRLDGRLYGLCSESERWRADAVCTVALAKLAQIPVVLLDRLDVLEPIARGPALGWLQAITSDLGAPQIFAAATLKAPPQIEGIHTIWLDNETRAAA